MKLYIDPGTGSMLFAILIGIIGALRYLLKIGIVKLKFLLSGGKAVSADSGKIPYAIFSDNKRYWNVFEPICREFDRRGVDVVYMTSSPDDPALDCKLPHVKTEFVGEENKAFAKLNFLEATVLLSTTPGLDVYQWKRSKKVDCYVHIPHSAGDILLYRMFGIDYYDAVLMTGPVQEDDIRQLETLRKLPAKDLYTVGVPYMDEMAKRLAESQKTEENGKRSAERTVLLAPSWGKSAILSKLGGEFIDRLLATGYHIIIRPHPQSFLSEKQMIDELMEKYPASEQLEWNSDRDNFDVLGRSDILISDFSGVIFDFAFVYDKPIIYTDTKFDKAPYDAWWLDKEIWTAYALPKTGMMLTDENMDDIKGMIDRCIDDPGFAEKRAEVRDGAWAYRGEGAKRTVDWIVKKHDRIVNGEEFIK